ncbi:hypothetical protein CNMCM8694_008177 [Aspergillus lentulus]|nr:hypothetical protein CNMCM8060_002015 [Aspergillus lentulus]KAF4178979.1 hypothetical protein CNMCM7927_002171 [Aspergillus lentulus]KAF4198827.1 hypothetical protein CNMCM8694_008177 [Aspergillus lentulus]
MSSQQILPSETIIHRYGSSLVGKTILITGVSGDSIAGELAIQLSAAGPHLLILSARAEERVTPIVEKIKSIAPNVNTRFLKMDLGDMSSIRKAVDTLHDIPKIDHLACVAGVMVPPYGTTKDGFETQFGVNYLANFLLVKLLLPKVRAAGAGSSIIIVASSAARSGKVDFEDAGFGEGKTYNPLVAYSQSNAARVMFVKSLAEKLGNQGIRVFSIDPGAVSSGLQRHFTPEFQEMVAGIMASGGLVDLDGRPIEMPPWTTKSEGAATIITGMIDPTIQGHNGAFLHNNAVAEDELNSHILNHDNQVKLWELRNLSRSPNRLSHLRQQYDQCRQRRKNNLANYAAKVSAASNSTMSAANLLSLFKIQYDNVFENPTPIAEVLVTSKETNFFTEYRACSPLRVMLGWDMQQQIGSGKFIRKIFDTARMSEHTTGESTPGYTTLSSDATDACAPQLLSRRYRSVAAPDMGGVVDTNLKVYGTANVRVVDGQFSRSRFAVT